MSPNEIPWHAKNIEVSISFHGNQILALALGVLSKIISFNTF
jgi:hypothetical protein